MLYKKKSPLLIFLLPGIILMFLFLYKPFVENIINSFYDMTSVIKMPGQEWKFLGLDNYKKLFSDPKIRIAIANSLKMMVLAVVFQVGIAFLLAVLVSLIKTGQQIFRTVYFFPIVISATAIGLLFKLFYNYNGGMLNQIRLAMGKEPINWLSPSLAFIMVSIPTIWSYVGFYFVIILTGLNAIPEEIYEAAAIDGCSRWKQVLYITIPLIRGVMCTCVTLAVTGALKVFDLPWVIVPKGAPQGVTHFLGTYMYEQTFSISNIDYGSTIAFVIVILGVIVSKIVSTLMKPDKNL
ncbi:MAG TPA: sugar ABC transporter permease [Lachnospiraceae bacterium]|jgi:raffinose/stachyose/melibiose transport system permease protein|nr:sugar ABC transporter permease [Lachnospiraceae bacterium]HBY72001.1 sugar ABC transporter permease [Lachnospiraceae bacterium]HCA69650.1 sugar ABC transporter permease [Lachnospiraceae bacterium]HCM12896.1 sugar ABC transporter permease [Lachnospiraceae bacterium]HCR39596.1 sugar ABC transporter permease [Lachnospiraceae bacterium]